MLTFSSFLFHPNNLLSSIHYPFTQSTPLIHALTQTIFSSIALYHLPSSSCNPDNDEPLLSGSGIVSREISDVALARWDKTIVEWQTSISKTSSQCLYARECLLQYR